MYVCPLLCYLVMPSVFDGLLYRRTFLNPVLLSSHICINVLLGSYYRLMCTFAGTESKTVFVKLFFVHRAQRLVYGLLQHPVCYSRYAQHSYSALWFRYLYPFAQALACTCLPVFADINFDSGYIKIGEVHRSADCLYPPLPPCVLPLQGLSQCFFCQ